ncbi:uncharacterized protein LOC124418833 isoform X2 [Lucilia cuprina]|uniref:uncharacterized protein LOC124418833 isoform X2 n=1 Tax=Lucilia cuprina TaxID=7375 RepID=UPI001F06FB67|nr:uncharacterized protein LOC124418833 isoform X2 [Lucilia cuprina]
MGANKNSNFQKCGEILIDIKRIKYKTKTYTYRCGFCSVNCEQLKKFIKHLEDKHFKNLEQELKDVLIQIEPEISRLTINKNETSHIETTTNVACEDTMSCNDSSSETEDNDTYYRTKKIKDEQNTKKYNITPKHYTSDVDNDDSKDSDFNRIYKKNLPLFIEQYKKHEILWDVNNIAFGVTPKRLEILGKIADEVKIKNRN